MIIENWNTVTDPDSTEIPPRLILTGTREGALFTGRPHDVGDSGDRDRRAFDIEGNVHVLGARLT